MFERDDIVKVRGALELYNDHPQLIVQRIRRCEAGEFQDTDFCPASARDPEEMFLELLGFVHSVGNEYVRSLLQSVLNDPLVVTAIKVAPGGVRLHHACRSGLWVMWTVSFLVRAQSASFRLHHFVSARPFFSSNSASMRFRLSSK